MAFEDDASTIAADEEAVAGELQGIGEAMFGDEEHDALAEVVTCPSRFFAAGSFFVLKVGAPSEFEPAVGEFSLDE